MDGVESKIRSGMGADAAFPDMESARERIRDVLSSEGNLLDASYLDDVPPCGDALVVDGARAEYNDRTSTYLVASAVCVDTLTSRWMTDFCCARLPHVVCLDAASSGLMMMQEIMTSVRVARQFPDRPVMIDGSRLSAVLNVHAFYRDLSREAPDILEAWRSDPAAGGGAQPGEIIRSFESDDWIAAYLRAPNIVGNLKFVTTTYFMRRFGCNDMITAFDDRTMIDMVILPGERLREMPFSLPRDPRQEFVIPGGYPYSLSARDAFRDTIDTGGKNNLYSIYYRAHGYHTAFKIEASGATALDPEKTDPILSWWRVHSEPVGLEEPYHFVVVDEHAKTGVRLGIDMVKETAVRMALKAGMSPVSALSYRSN